MHQIDNTHNQIDTRQNALACPHDEIILLDYITGLVSDELSTEIESTPASLAEAKSLAQEIGPWMPYLHRLACPDTEQLVSCQEKGLSGTERLVIKRHIDICPLCTAEFKILQDMDEVVLGESPSWVRQIIEAVLQPSTGLAGAEPVRGNILHYRTPDLMIHINTRKGQGKPRSWTLRGQLRDEDGLSFTDLESVELKSLDPAEEDTIYHHNLEPNGSFVLRGLPAGQYTLNVLTPDSEIVIRQLDIG